MSFEIVQAMAASIATQLDAPSQENIVFADVGVYYGAAESQGLSKEQVDAVNHFNLHYAAASGHALEALAADHFAAGNEEVLAYFTTPTGTVSHRIMKEFQHGEHVHPGYIVTGWQIRDDSGVMQQVQESMSSAILNALSVEDEAELAA